MRHSQKPRSNLEDSQHPGETFETPLSELTASITAQIRSRLVDYVRGEILSALEEVVAGLDAGLAGRRDARTPLSPPRQPPEDLRSDNEDLASESLDPWIIPATMDQDSRGQGTDDSAGPVDDGIYEGTVRLRVDGNRSAVLLMLRFVSELQHRSEFRVLRLVRNDEGGPDVLVGLRLPLDMDEALSQIDIVAAVRPLPNEGAEPLLNIELAHSE